MLVHSACYVGHYPQKSYNKALEFKRAVTVLVSVYDIKINKCKTALIRNTCIIA